MAWDGGRSYVDGLCVREPAALPRAVSAAKVVVAKRIAGGMVAAAPAVSRMVPDRVVSVPGPPCRLGRAPIGRRPAGRPTAGGRAPSHL